MEENGDIAAIGSASKPSKVKAGDRVMYVMDQKPTYESETTPHRIRPAIVVEAWNGGKLPPDGSGCCNLQVFVDGSNDIGHSQHLRGERDLQNYIKRVDGLMWVTSATFDAEKKPGTWHFAERE